MSNPFEEPSGPRYGNAYDSTPIASPPPTLGMASPALPPRNKPQAPPAVPSSPYGTQRMPSPSNYHQTSITTNAWQESNKTLEEERTWSPQPQNAYQYSGTPYGNSSAAENVYSPQPAPATLSEQPPVTSSNKIEAPMSVSDNEATYNNQQRSVYSKIRFYIRIALFIAAIGHLGFAAGASPYSQVDVPLDSKSCFYYLFAVAILSIIYSGYHIFHFLYRKFGKAEKMKRTILILCDLLMTLLWGIGIIVEIVKYTCKIGAYDGWCNFYNTSIFFGFISFVMYIVMLGWDAVGGCIMNKRN